MLAEVVRQLKEIENEDAAAGRLPARLPALNLRIPPCWRICFTNCGRSRVRTLPPPARESPRRMRDEHPGSRLGHDNRLGADHSDVGVGLAVWLNALGTAHPPFADGIIDQLSRASSGGADDNLSGLNFALAAIAGMTPKDHIETMLCVQMVSIHNATMALARRLLRAETLIQQDSAERALNRLARTFAAQVETLKNYRRGGAQRITVEHVTVNEGGQAIVGSIAGKGVGNVQDPEATS